MAGPGVLQASTPRGRYRKAPSSPAPRARTSSLPTVHKKKKKKKENKKVLLHCCLYLALPQKPTAVTSPTWSRRALGAQSREQHGAISLPSAFRLHGRSHWSPAASPSPCPARWGHSRCSRHLPAPVLAGPPQAPSGPGPGAQGLCSSSRRKRHRTRGQAQR